jgi:hypothetical protein
MQLALIERISADERAVVFPAGDTFLLTYPEFLRYFQDLAVIERHHLIIAANFTYGWMPTMLRFKSQDFDAAVAVLNHVKAGQTISDQELSCLAGVINNSLVGASKLLHFIDPSRYAIWDSRVYQYLHGSFSLYQLHRLRNYHAYLDACATVTAHPAFSPVHQSMNAKIGYPVTPLRALELVMFMRSAPPAVALEDT